MKALLCFIKTITEKLNWDNFSVIVGFLRNDYEVSI